MRTLALATAAALLLTGPALAQSEDWFTNNDQGSDIGARHGTPGYSKGGVPYQRSPSINKLAREAGKTLAAGARRAHEIATTDNRPGNSQGAYGPGNQPGRGTGDPGGNVNKGNVNSGR